MYQYCNGGDLADYLQGNFCLSVFNKDSAVVC